MSPRTQRLFKRFGYPLFGVITFFVCIYAFFPTERLKGLLEDHLNAAGDMTVTIGSLSTRPLLGFVAEEVTVRLLPKATISPRIPVHRNRSIPAPPAAPDNKQPEKPQIIELSEVRLGVGLFSLLFGTLDASYSIDAFGGRISGELAQKGKKGWHIKLNAKSIAAKKVPQLQGSGVPLRGTLSARIDLSSPNGKMADTNGTISLECNSCSFGDGKARLLIPPAMITDPTMRPFLAQGIRMPKIALGQPSFLVTVENGVARFDSAHTRSPDIELYIDGSVNLQDNMAFSLLNGYLRFKITEKLKSRSPEFQLLDSFLAKGKRADGYVGLSVSGMLRKPNIKPSKVAPPAPRPRAATPTDRTQHRAS